MSVLFQLINQNRIVSENSAKMSKSREDKENMYAAQIEQRMMSHEAYGKP